MKRAIILIALVVIVFFGVNYVETSAPIMPIVGTSMEPMLKLGDLIVIGPVDTHQVKEGDVIVFNVPGLIREKYNYPAVVAHRVIKVINDSGSVSFRTKGDNTGEDPFTVLSSDLRGQVVKQISHGGYLPLFLQSKQGRYFMVVALVILVIYFYGGDIQQKWQKTRRSLFTPVFEENQKMIQRQDEAMEMSARSLQSFATAMGEYAKHLASHTSAIQGLSTASQDLARTTAEQEKLLGRLYKSMEEKTTTPSVEAEKAAPEIPGVSYRPPQTITPPQTVRTSRRMSFTPVPVAPVWQAREIAHSPEAIAHTSPVHFAHKAKEVTPPPASHESDRIADGTVKKEMPVPGHWRNLRRSG